MGRIQYIKSLLMMYLFLNTWCFCGLVQIVFVFQTHIFLAKDAVSSNEPRMKLIGVVKTRTKDFPILYLSNIYLDKNGYFRSEILNNDTYVVDKLFMLVGINQDIRYFLQQLRTLLKGHDT